MQNTLILAQQATEAAGSQGAIFQFIFFGLMIAGFWFLIIAPQRKRQKAHEKMISALNSGDEVLTVGGIYGTITNVKDDRFVIRIADNTKIEVSRASVQAKIEGQTSAK